MKKKETGKQ